MKVRNEDITKWKFEDEKIPVFEDETTIAADHGFIECENENFIAWYKGDSVSGRFMVSRRNIEPGQTHYKSQRQYHAYKENKIRVVIGYDDENQKPITEEQYADMSFTTIYKTPEGKSKSYNDLLSAIIDCEKAEMNEQPTTGN